MENAEKLASITKAVSEEEIKALETGNGGFTYATLKSWGVPCPPPKGWKKKLIENWRT